MRLFTHLPFPLKKIIQTANGIDSVLMKNVVDHSNHEKSVQQKYRLFAACGILIRVLSGNLRLHPSG